MRRLFGVLLLFACTVPVGLSVVGCARKSNIVYCNAGDSGPIVGTVTSISLSPTLVLTGESLNYGQIGSALTATAQDCKGSSVSVSSYTYATSDMSIADINPTNGIVCGGSWNRNSGGGVPDYTVCTPPAPTNTKSVAYVTASNGGTTSNPIAVYVHPVVTGVVLAPPLSAAACAANPQDITSNCCPQATSSVVTAPPYDGNSCISQNQSRQIAAKVYASANGTTNPAENITCKVGHLTFAPQGSTNIVSIDANGVATANQPGSVLVTATVANTGSASSAGFFSTCPPASIVLSPVGITPVNGAINIALNSGQALTASVVDTAGQPLTGLSLEFNSTTPQTISASSGSILATYPGTATITAVCQPPTCNPAPFSQTGLFGNGNPVTSNGITATASGNTGSVIYIGSTNSQYLLPVDFTTNNQIGSLIKLPYAPNSMVISQDGSAIYLGSSQGLITVTTAANSVSAANQAIPGTVLSVSPDGSTLVVTDPTRNTVSLVSSNGSVGTTYGGTGVSSQWTPDSQTVYVVTNSNVLLTHNTAFNWQSSTTGEVYRDVAVTVPGVGAYFAGDFTEGRTYCPITVLNTGTGNPPTATNTFFPSADVKLAQTDRIAATTDGKHIIGAAVVSGGAPRLSDVQYSVSTPNATAPNSPLVCTTTTGPVSFISSVTTTPLSGITVSGAGAITGIDPATNNGLSFVTYTGSSGRLPYYIPASSGLGTLSYLTLGNGATTASAPVAGTWATDNKTFYVGTSGDNQVHLIGVNGTAVSESSVIAPKLPDAGGNITTPNLIVQRPKRATS